MSNWPIELVFHTTRAGVLNAMAAITEWCYWTQARTNRRANISSCHIGFKPTSGWANEWFRPVTSANLNIHNSPGRSWQRDEGVVTATLNVTLAPRPWTYTQGGHNGAWPTTGTYYPQTAFQHPLTGVSTTTSTYTRENDFAPFSPTFQSEAAYGPIYPAELRFIMPTTETYNCDHIWCGWGRDLSSGSAKHHWDWTDGTYNRWLAWYNSVDTSHASEIEHWADYTVDYNSGNWAALGTITSEDVH